MVFSGTFTVVSLVVIYGWTQDNERLRHVAFAETRNYATLPERIVALNAWVYRNEGFAKNRNFFLLESLGPTPLQVMEAGGDCADKSRLLAALLAEIDVKSTLVMLYPCKTCDPVHTIVEARGPGFSIALDPVYDLYFSDGAGGYLGVDQVATQQELVWRTLNDLRHTRGERDKINFYSYDGIHFENARTVNWNRNVITRAGRAVISRFGMQPYRVMRPRWLEDPKLLVGLGFFIVGATFLVLLVVSIILRRSLYEQLPGLEGRS